MFGVPSISLKKALRFVGKKVLHLNIQYRTRKKEGNLTVVDEYYYHHLSKGKTIMLCQWNFLYFLCIAICPFIFLENLINGVLWHKMWLEVRWRVGGSIYLQSQQFPQRDFWPSPTIMTTLNQILWLHKMHESCHFFRGGR